MKTGPLRDRLVEWRHDFHRHPELGFDVHRTSARVAELLERFGVEVAAGIGGTGLVGILKRGSSGRGIGVRADMDALPIAEANDFSHVSQTDGTMHACGHDGHTAMLLGAAKYLAESGEFDGTAHFIFQPAEEHGRGGAAMIDDGLFDRFAIDEMFGAHNLPGLEVGAFATRAGPMTASEALFEIRVQAAGGHAALPHMGVDAITVGAQIVNALQTIVSRKLNPSLNGVVSVTDFTTDGKRNVLPGSAVLTGDARALTPETNRTIEARMREIVAGVCAAHGVAAQVDYETCFPAVINAPEQAAAAVRVAAGLVGEERVDGACEPKLFSDDFAHMAAARPACYVLMGNGVEGGCGRPLHSADYDFNDRALVTGSSFWVELVERRLSAGRCSQAA